MTFPGIDSHVMQEYGSKVGKKEAICVFVCTSLFTLPKTSGVYNSIFYEIVISKLLTISLNLDDGRTGSGGYV
jgi:hypothetical protein